MDQPAIDAIIARLSDPWKPTRNAAAQELLDLGEAVIPHMADLLAGDRPDPDLAHYAVWVLEMLDTPECEAVLSDFWDRHG